MNSHSHYYCIHIQHSSILHCIVVKVPVLFVCLSAAALFFHSLLQLHFLIPDQIPIVFSNFESVVSLGSLFPPLPVHMRSPTNSVRFSYCVCVSRLDEVAFTLVRRSKRLKKQQAPGLSTRWSRPPHRLRKGARLKGFCLENFFTIGLHHDTILRSTCRGFFPRASVRHTTVFVENF
jgi:hypothetical protein